MTPQIRDILLALGAGVVGWFLYVVIVSMLSNQALGCMLTGVKVKASSTTPEKTLMPEFNYNNPHTPHAHKNHTKPCGCVTDMRDLKIVCKCGAAYDPDEVWSFPDHVFKCYDCGLTCGPASEHTGRYKG